MGYTIIEYLDPAEQRQKRAIGRYDCAYDAVDAIRAALQNDNDRVWGWYLVDESGTVLFGPPDLAAIMADSDEFEASPPEPRTASGSATRKPFGVRHAGGLLSDSDLSWD